MLVRNWYCDVLTAALQVGLQGISLSSCLSSLAREERLQTWFRGYGKESAAVLYLLSDHVRVMTGFDFERAVVHPEVNRVGNASHTPFVYLDRTLSERAGHSLLGRNVPVPQPLSQQLRTLDPHISSNTQTTGETWLRSDRKCPW